MTFRDDIRDASELLGLEQRIDEPWVVYSVTGDLDLITAPILRDALAPDALPGHRTCIALDLSRLDFCDSAGLGVLVGIHKRLRARGGQLVLLRPRARMARQLHITAIDHVLSVRQTLEAG